MVYKVNIGNGIQIDVKDEKELHKMFSTLQLLSWEIDNLLFPFHVDSIDDL